MEDSPYNENNKWITEEYIFNIMNEYNILNFKINNINFYKKAFIHKSYLKNSDFNIPPPNTIDLQEESYERMEWLGDTLLEVLISKYLYERFDINEGFLSRIRTRIVRGETLAEFSRILGFNQYIIISKRTENDNGRNSKKILNNIFESFLCAIYLDNNNNISIVEDFLIKFIELNIDFVDIILNNDNYKDQLIRYVKNNLKKECIYQINNLNNSKYECIITIEDLIFKEIGDDKKKISQLASQRGLKYYNII
tara:strand:+ start:50 stop:808 length:759 start_codon:yes stop_codon:yes gene_type:complete